MHYYSHCAGWDVLALALFWTSKFRAVWQTAGVSATCSQNLSPCASKNEGWDTEVSSTSCEAAGNSKSWVLLKLDCRKFSKEIKADVTQFILIKSNKLSAQNTSLGIIHKITFFFFFLVPYFLLNRNVINWGRHTEIGKHRHTSWFE